MSELPSDVREALAILVVDVTYRVRYLIVASASLFFYDYAITLDDEITHIWSSKWTLTRVLFFVNRYLPMVIIGLILGVIYTPNASPKFCDGVILNNFILSSFSAIVIQAVHVIRLWYLFAGSPRIRYFVLGAWLFSGIITYALLGESLAKRNSPQPLPEGTHGGCPVPDVPGIWRIFLPSFILHTMFYLLMLIRALKSSASGSRYSPLFQRLHRDGGLFYLAVFFSVGFTGIGAILTHAPKVNIPAIYSDFMMTVTSVCTSRVILATEDLAKTLETDVKYLLNPAELSRVTWKTGRHGELIVEGGMLDDTPVPLVPLRGVTEVRTTVQTVTD